MSTTTSPVKSERWIVIRRFGKRGGKKVRLPDTLKELRAVASEQFSIECANIREVDTEAEITDIQSIEANAVVLALTAEEEADFS